jgi:hypothetical protein
MDSAEGWVATDGTPPRHFSQHIDAQPTSVLMLVQPLTGDQPSPS